MRPFRIRIAVIALFVVGCGEDFSQRTLLDRYRVIGIAANKPEINPTDTLQITAVDFDPAEVDPAIPSGQLEYVWSICPFSLGSVVKFECAMEEVYFETEGPQFTFPLALLFANEQADQIFDPDGTLRDPQTGEPVMLSENDREVSLLSGLTVFVTLSSGRNAVGGEQSVKRVVIRETCEYTTEVLCDAARGCAWEGGACGPTRRDLWNPDPLNQNPEIVSLTVEIDEDDLRLAQGDTIDLRLTPVVTPESEQTFNEGSDTEELLYSWFCSKGEFAQSWTVGDEATNTLEIRDAEPGMKVKLIVAVRDGRGGFDSAERTLEVIAAADDNDDDESEPLEVRLLD